MRYAVILGGGVGTRLWPASKPSRPKQFLRLFSDRSLLQETYYRLVRAFAQVPEAFSQEADPRSLDRGSSAMASSKEAQPSADRSAVFIVLPHDQVALAREHLVDMPEENFLVEPVPRGTAAAVGLAAARLIAQDPDALVAAFPADHFIPHAEQAAFARSLLRAVEEAERTDSIVLIGIRPTRVEPGYGHIELGEEAIRNEGEEADQPPIRPVASFIEKPPEEEASRMMETGRYLWNGGIFVARAATILDRLREFLPRHFEALSAASSPDAFACGYSSLDPVSFDHGVLQPLSRIVSSSTADPPLQVVPGNFVWSDVGNWASVYDLARSGQLPVELWHRDEAGNALRGVTGRVRAVQSELCLILNLTEPSLPAPRINLLGLERLAVIVDEEEILICPLDRAQWVRELAAE